MLDEPAMAVLGRVNRAVRVGAAPLNPAGIAAIGRVWPKVSLAGAPKAA